MSQGYNCTQVESNVVRFFLENAILPTKEAVEFVVLLADFMLAGPTSVEPDLDAIWMRLQEQGN